MSRLVSPFAVVLLALVSLFPATGQSAFARAIGAHSALPATQDEIVFVDADGIERGTVSLEEIADPFEDYPADRPPAEDSRYVVLTVAFEATGDEAFEASPSHLTLRDANGFLWGSASVPREEDAFPDLSSQTLAPGNRISGAVGFIVPEDTGLDDLFYQPDSGRLIRLADLRDDPEPGPSVGDEVTYVDTEGAEGLVTVREFEDPFEDYPEDRDPEDEARYVLLTVSVENSGDTALDASPGQVTLRDADGFLWGNATVPREDDAFPELSSHTLAPDDRISGVIGFIVPEDAELTTIYYQPESGRVIVLADLAQETERDDEDEDEDEDEDAG